MKTSSPYQQTKQEPLLYLKKKTASKHAMNISPVSGPYTKLKKDPTSSIVSEVTKRLIEE